MLAKRLRRRPNINPTLVNVSCLLGGNSTLNAVLMLANRLRRWPNTKPELDQHIVLAGW